MNKKQTTFDLPSGVSVEAARFVFYQDSDTNQSPDEGQELEVYTQNSGGGNYICIETKRWAIDHDEIDKVVALLKKVLELSGNGEI